MRKAITLTAQWSESQQHSDWRQYRYNLRQLKRKLRETQQSKRRRVCAKQTPAGILQAHQTYITHAQYYLDKIQATLAQTDGDNRYQTPIKRARFPTLNAYSFDKGFHSPINQTDLAQQLDQVTLPKKGKLSKVRQAMEQSEQFTQARRAHSAVESAIHALEVHGLDKCPDHGINGFQRYVSLAVAARNIHRIGDILWQQDVKRAHQENAKNSRYRRTA